MRLLRSLTGPLFVGTGILHFTRRHWYEAIVPDYLPAHRAIVYASGVAEIAGGAALMVPATRRAGGWWLIATLVAIFPANVWMAQHPERYRLPGGRAGLYARLPFQAVFIALVRAAMR
jgi:uncharacterized membrane protein